VRSATPDCTIMLHFGEETNSSGSEAAHNAKLTKRMKEYLRKTTGRSAKTINKWLAADTYFTAPAARDAKLIDEVTL
jgi:ATP-dependent protease ClpP protease subunit